MQETKVAVFFLNTVYTVKVKLFESIRYRVTQNRAK